MCFIAVFHMLCSNRVFAGWTRIERELDCGVCSACARVNFLLWPNGRSGPSFRGRAGNKNAHPARFEGPSQTPTSSRGLVVSLDA